MFCAGGLARATLNADPGNRSGLGGAATFFVFLYTAIFGATWSVEPASNLSCPYLHSPLEGLLFLGSIRPKYSRFKSAQRVMLGVLLDGLSEMGGRLASSRNTTHPVYSLTINLGTASSNDLRET